jgi:hypothetical protein
MKSQLVAVRRISLASLATLALGCGSCGDADDGRPPVFPAQGRIVVGGRPADHALVILVPTGTAGDPSLRPSGRCDAEGRFRLGTYAADDGAPAGEYAVLIRWSRRLSGPRDDPDMGPDRLGGRGLDSINPPARVTIMPGANDLGTIRVR